MNLYFSGANLLVLDEPTNYLDVDARERVEACLEAYPGAVIVVSHDRYLLRRVANRVVAIDQGVVTDYPDGLDVYEHHLLEAADADDHTGVDELTRQLRQLSDVLRDTGQ